jgi:hypothetical protein
MMKKLFAIALAAASCVLASGAASARTNVYWSIGINAPPIGTVVSNVPVYAPAPLYVGPAPAYYEPAPVFAPAPVYAPSPRVVYRPVPVVYGGYGYGGRYWDGRVNHWRHHHHGWRHDEYGAPYRGGWQPVPGDQRRYPH